MVGAMTARLLLSWDHWTHRRVERITYCDSDALRRDVSVDFTLPNWFHEIRQGKNRSVPEVEAKRQLVPIGFLRKGVLVNFGIRNEAEVSLPLLNSAQNAQVAEAVLLSIAERALEIKIPNEIHCDIRNLVRAEHHLDGESDSPAEIARGQLFESRDRWLNVRETLSEHEAFTSIASTLTGYFLALTVMRIHRHDRRVIHFSYEESLHEDVGSGARRLVPYVQRLALGEPRVMAVGSPAASQAHSYHLEVEAPEGHMISKRESFLIDRGRKVAIPARSTGTYRRAHFHFSHIQPGSTAAAIVNVLPRPYTIIRGAAGTSALALIALTTVTARFGEVEQVNGETATAILLAFVGLMSLFMMRSGEQDMSTMLLFPLRALVTGPIALSFLGALILLGRPGHVAGTIALGVLSVLALVTTVMLLRNWWAVSSAMRAHR